MSESSHGGGRGPDWMPSIKDVRRLLSDQMAILEFDLNNPHPEDPAEDPDARAKYAAGWQTYQDLRDALAKLDEAESNPIPACVLALGIIAMERTGINDFMGTQGEQVSPAQVVAGPISPRSALAIRSMLAEAKVRSEYLAAVQEFAETQVYPSGLEQIAERLDPASEGIEPRDPGFFIE